MCIYVYIYLYDSGDQYGCTADVRTGHRGSQKHKNTPRWSQTYGSGSHCAGHRGLDGLQQWLRYQPCEGSGTSPLHLHWRLGGRCFQVGYMATTHVALWHIVRLTARNMSLQGGRRLVVGSRSGPLRWSAVGNTHLRPHDRDPPSTCCVWSTDIIPGGNWVGWRQDGPGVGGGGDREKERNLNILFHVKQYFCILNTLFLPHSCLLFFLLLLFSCWFLSFVDDTLAP